MKHKASHHRRPIVTAFAAATLAALSALLTGCGSAPPTHYHTLLPPPSTNGQATVAMRLDWDVLPVTVPTQVDQPQWVLRTSDGSLVVLEQERWIAPLSDEIHGAIVQRLTKSFGPPQIGPSADDAASWRIRIDVRRFDLMPNREARFEADWSLRWAGGAISCHATVSRPVTGPDYVALARAQQQAVAHLADAIGAAITATRKGSHAACQA